MKPELEEKNWLHIFDGHHDAKQQQSLKLLGQSY